MCAQPLASETQIQKLQERWRHHRNAAITGNEGPDGVHRRLAESLERQLKKLHQSQTPRTTTSWPVACTVGFGVGAYVAIAASLGWSLLNASRFANAEQSRATPTSIPRAKTAVTPPSYSAPTPATQTEPDPAIAMQSRFYEAKLGGSYAGLDAGLNNFRRLSGTLARIQAISLRRRSAAYQLPSVWINRSSDQCFDESTIGAYNPQCQVIKLDYSDGTIRYEYPIEMETTLAHEWGHHLIRLSGAGMSPVEQEVVSDCFAGAVFGYYARHGLITLEEAGLGLKLMADFGNNSASGHHPNRETRLTSFLGGWYSVANPSHPQAKALVPSCASLDRVIDIAKIRELGITWT